MLQLGSLKDWGMPRKGKFSGFDDPHSVRSDVGMELTAEVLACNSSIQEAEAGGLPPV